MTRRTIQNWLQMPEVQKIIEVISAQKEVSIPIDRSFVEALTLEERIRLEMLLKQQEKLDNDPTARLAINELGRLLT